MYLATVYFHLLFFVNQKGMSQSLSQSHAATSETQVELW